MLIDDYDMDEKQDVAIITPADSPEEPEVEPAADDCRSPTFLFPQCMQADGFLQMKPSKPGTCLWCQILRSNPKDSIRGVLRTIGLSTGRSMDLFLKLADTLGKCTLYSRLDIVTYRLAGGYCSFHTATTLTMLRSTSSKVSRINLQKNGIRVYSLLWFFGIRMIPQYSIHIVRISV